MRKAIILAIFILSYQISNAQWEWQNPKPQGYHFSSIAFCDNDNGIAVGKYGTLLKTTDGGETWNLMPRLGETPLLEVVSPDSAAYLIFSDNCIYKSVDYGQTWAVISHFNGLYPYGKIQFLNENTGLAYKCYSEGNTLFKSSDGGVIWTPKLQTAHNLVLSLAFSDSQNGIVITPDSLYRTSDGAETFLTDNHVLQQMHPFAVEYAGQEVFYLSAGTYQNNGNIESCTLLKSTDNGTSWITVGDNTAPLSKLYFVDSHWGFGFNCTEDYADMYQTTDGGITWEYMNRLDDTRPEITIVDSATLFLKSGWKIFKWRGQEAGWEQMLQGSDYSFFGMQFLNETVGYAGSTSGKVLKTSDGGKTWIPKAVTAYSWFDHEVSFADVNNGLVSTYDTLFVTHDGAETWYAIADPLTTSRESITSIDYADPATAYLLARVTNAQHIITGYKLLRSVDTLQTWTELPIPFGRYADMVFLDASTGFLTGCYDMQNYSDGFILKTTDGGQNWSELENNYNTQGTFTKIQLIDENTGVVEFTNHGVKTVLLPVRNGIVSNHPLWSHSDDTYAAYNPHPFHFSTLQSGFVFYQDDLYRLQTDSLWGPSWSLIDKFPGFVDLCFSSPTNGFLYQGNKLIHLSPDANPMVIEPVLSSDQPSRIGVTPVPATDRLVFTYTGKVEMAADLTLVNLQGQSVIHTSNVVFAPGIGFSLDVSHVPAGIYLYRFAHEKGLITGKVIISR
ncbi:MAG: YCF48-related protein [Bacteroidales bacterium]|nr:YCF48-related protein [Bacteroidales bacterium]MDD3663709.1 YCF48-related protein [Bacteroidales bacterium]